MGGHRSSGSSMAAPSVCYGSGGNVVAAQVASHGPSGGDDVAALAVCHGSGGGAALVSESVEWPMIPDVLAVEGMLDALDVLDMDDVEGALDVDEVEGAWSLWLADLQLGLSRSTWHCSCRWRRRLWCSGCR